MNSKILFSERQTFRQQPWMWLFLAALATGMIALPFVLCRSAENSEDLVALLFVETVFAALAVFFMVGRLDTMITKEGVSIKFFPLNRSFRLYRWGDISKAEVVKYSVFESKSLGIKYNAKGALSYHIGGNKGLRLELTKGRKLFIGTQKAEELEAILYKIGQLSYK